MLVESFSQPSTHGPTTQHESRSYIVALKEAATLCVESVRFRLSVGSSYVGAYQVVYLSCTRDVFGCLNRHGLISFGGQLCPAAENWSRRGHGGRVCRISPPRQLMEVVGP